LVVIDVPFAPNEDSDADKEPEGFDDDDD